MKQLLLAIHKRIGLGIVLVAWAALVLSSCSGGSSTGTATQTISFAAVPTLLSNGMATVSATTSSGLPVTYSSATPSICTVNSNTGVVTDIVPGTCVIAANQAGNSYYVPAQTTLSITVAAISTPSAQTISFDAVPSLTLHGTATVSATASSGLPVTYSSTTPSICTVNSSTGVVTDIAAGACIIAANQAGNANYTAAQQVTQSIAVAHIQTTYNVTVTFEEPETQPYNTIFTGFFTLDSSTNTVSDLTGLLTECMWEPPITTIALAYQLSAVSDGNGGLLVSTFALNTTDVFFGGGFPTGKTKTFGNSNAYVTIYVNLANPTAALTPAQVNLLVYADCTPLGMMGPDCMTGVNGGGSMAGYPISQTITVAGP